MVVASCSPSEPVSLRIRSRVVSSSIPKWTSVTILQKRFIASDPSIRCPTITGVSFLSHGLFLPSLAIANNYSETDK